MAVRLPAAPEPAGFGRLLARRHGIVRAVAAAAGLAVLATGAGAGLDQALRSGRDALRSHSASGEVHLVEMDARSLQEIDRWPWPRSVHGALVDRLRSAGVRSIAFDVDFSTLSTAVEDAAFAAALKRAGGSVILPTFRQDAGSGSSDQIDSVPAKPFLDNVFLAAVNVVPDPDGAVRHMLLGVSTAGTPRPSLATMVAERQAEIGRSFAIDYSVEPRSIPRHSFIDVIEGRVDSRTLNGKRMIVGATAIEMGDRYPVPRHGVIPGVVIQALAAETLLSGPLPSRASGLWPLLAALALIAVTIRGGSEARRAFAFATGALAIAALPLATEQFLALTMPLGPALASLAAAAAGAVAGSLGLRFRQRALTDGATGLPNLPALELQAAGTDDPVVVVARIERFAALAAGLGPAATVNLLHRIADRLCFSQSHSIHRIDEGSLAWVETRGDGDSLEDRLVSLVALMRSPVDCGRLVDVVLRFGIAETSPAGAKQQIANASLAAVHAARNGARWERFDAGATDETDWHLSLLGELDTAMLEGQVWNAYQPKLDLASGRITAVEALVRWEHPQRGRISPDQFIPVVEEHGRIRELTAHVMGTALTDAAHWRALGHDLGVAVNVSATLLADRDFAEQFRAMLQASPLPPEKLTLEITETAAMEDPDKAVAALETWRALGVRISIDDYGTGQSSLAYLQRLPASELKIDMSFVQTLETNRTNAILVRSTIAMAKELRMEVVAEGVETAATLELLKTMGCDIAQGYFIGRPVSTGDLIASLSAEPRQAA